MNARTMELNQAPNTETQPVDLKAIQTWLITYLSQLLDIDPATLDVSHSFDSYGLDSWSAVSLTGELADWLGFELDPAILYEHSTVDELAQHLAQESSRRRLLNHQAKSK